MKHDHKILKALDALVTLSLILISSAITITLTVMLYRKLTNQ